MFTKSNHKWLPFLSKAIFEFIYNLIECIFIANWSKITLVNFTNIVITQKNNIFVIDYELCKSIFCLICCFSNRKTLIVD
jgi:uncharacterized membrane protein YagU involved in acid resistance